MGKDASRTGQRRPRRNVGVAIALLVWLVLMLVFASDDKGSAGTLDFAAFGDKVTANQVKTAIVADSGAVHGELVDGTAYRSRIPAALDPARITEQLATAKVEVRGEAGSGPWIDVLVSIVPMVLFVGVLLWMGWRAQGAVAGGLGGLGSFGRSKARIAEQTGPSVTFDDIAGYTGVKEEIGEVVDFLRAPERYAAAGAKGPRGVIMVGPPGTGKTLFARALAGQAEVPFLSVTGSSFVEMFVGVGASRVRDLFAQARAQSPSIVFIDEIDAIGGRRGTRGVGGNDEREQTLNQLLAEMDGFDSTSGVVVLAATNRPEILDPALLRPGRFDRQVTIPLPDVAERAAILAVHARSKHLRPEVDLDRVARSTPGFSGADLSNLLNEAAIHAVRDGRSTIEPDDVDAARDRILLGRRDASHALLGEERIAVAFHEAGHALVAQLCPHADPVAKVSILPSGRALGVTQQLPAAERRLYTEAYLQDLLAVRLGGRAAEIVMLGQKSTGAADDLAGATAVATRMVREFGLSPELGPVGYPNGESSYLGADPSAPDPYSADTARVVDLEVARLVRAAEQRAVDLLRAHRAALERLGALLCEAETIDGSEVEHVLATSVESPIVERT